jgi:hypothetical protein
MMESVEWNQYITYRIDRFSVDAPPLRMHKDARGPEGSRLSLGA